MRGLVIGVLLLSCSYCGGQQSAAGPAKGTLIVDGGGTTDLVKDRFVALAGGKNAQIVVILTGASSLRFGPDKVILNPDWPREPPEWAAYEKYLKSWLGTDHVMILHTRDRNVANSEDFMKPLSDCDESIPGSRKCRADR